MILSNFFSPGAMFFVAWVQCPFELQAIWSRTFPVYCKLRELIDSDVIGEIRHVWSSLSRYIPTLVPRIVQKELAGGVILDLGELCARVGQSIKNFQIKLHTMHCCAPSDADSNKE